MITTGSKIFFALAGVAFFAAVLYGVITNGLDHGGVVNVISGDGAVDALLGPITFGYKGGVGDHVGYSILMGFAAATFGLGVAASAFRDTDAESLAELDGAEVAPTVPAAVGLNAWPFLGGVAVAAAVIGLATSPILFIIGCTALAIVAVEWTISTWAEQGTADATVNRLVRNRVMLPVEIPVGATLLVGAIVYAFSRVFLATSKLGAVWVALALAVAVFGVALIINSRPQIRRSLVVSVLVVGVITVLTVGIAGAIAGPREFEKHGSEHEGAAPAAPVIGQEG